MSYSRRDILDFKTVITAALYNNLQDGIEELFNQIGLVTETGIPKLMVHPLYVVATEESQIIFPIKLSTFDVNTDTVFVQSGRTMLAPEQDFNIVGNNIVLTEGVPVGRTILIYIFKNVPIGEEGSVSGRVIADKTLPLKKLAEMPTASDVGALPNIKDIYLNKSTNWDSLEEGIYRVNTWAGSGGSNYPPIDTQGICIVHERNDAIVQCLLSGTNVVARAFDGTSWSAWTTGFLPLTGGTLSGLLGILDGYVSIIGDRAHACLSSNQYLDNSNGTRQLLLFNESITSLKEYMLQLRDWDEIGSKSYVVFGEHNKPFGSYTGNGSATERKISIGGIGSTLTIYSNYELMFATPYGTWRLSSTDSANIVAVSYLPPNLMKFVDGVLTISTNEHHVNNSGVNYSWSL